MHQGVLIGGIVYDNIHTSGIPYAQWVADFFSLGEIILEIIPIK